MFGGLVLVVPLFLLLAAGLAALLWPVPRLRAVAAAPPTPARA